MRSSPVRNLILSLGCAAAAAFSAGIPDPMDDAASLEYERFVGAYPGTPETDADREYNRYAVSTYFPAGTVLDREAFGNVEVEVLDRRFSAGGADLGGPLQQRYALSAGLEAIKRERHRGFAIASASYNSDFRRLDWDGVGYEFIYAHTFTSRAGVEWGVGLDLMQYNDQWYPYPLLFLDWWMLERTKGRINGDVAELRQFLGTAFCLTLGVRYNLFYGSLGEEAAFEFESAGLEQGLEYRFRSDVVLRVKAKEFFWGSDSFSGGAGPGGMSGGPEGGSLRLVLAYSP